MSTFSQSAFNTQLKKTYSWYVGGFLVFLVLLAIWFVATFVMGWFARELNEITIIGPLGFYMSAQGSLIIYVAIIWFYQRYMNNLDKQYGVDEGELD